MKIRNLSLLIGLLVFILIGAPLVAMNTGLPVMLIVGFILFAAVMPKGERLALFAEAPDISAMATEFVKFGGDVIKKAVNKLSVKGNPFYSFYPNLTGPLVLPKFSASGEPRPYRAQDDTSGNGIAVTDQILHTHGSKWDMDFDFEKWHETYMASDTEQPYREYMLGQMADEYMGFINDDVIFSGDYNGAGSTAAAITNGWGTHITDDIAGAGAIEVIATGTVDATNAVEKHELILSSLPAWAREQGNVEGIMSYAQFDNYKKNYRATYGYSFQPRQDGYYYLDGTNIKIRPESMFKTSNRIVYSVAKNLAWGMKGQNIKVYATARRNIIEVRPILYVGTQIADFDKIWVNDQA
jgi:hypothetical protein